MKVKVVGWYTPKTEQVLLNAQAALNAVEPRNKVELISDDSEMVKMGIVRKPALIINASLKIAGRVPSISEITKWIEEEMMEEIAA